MQPMPLRIAIVRLSALGDIVNTAVVLQIIHSYTPNAVIDWFVEEAFAPILYNHPLCSEPCSKTIRFYSLSTKIRLVSF